MKRALSLFLIITLLFSLVSCDTQQQSSSDTKVIKSFRDIPNITYEEIEAIEALQTSRKSFSYGQLFETEAFILPDGTYAGFTVKLCELLSDLFEIEFKLQIYEWEDLITGLEQKSIDFTGDLTPTTERMQLYYMTHPIAERSQGLFTLAGTSKIESERDVNGLRIGSLKGSVDVEMVLISYPHLSFTAVEVDSFASVAEMLKNGEIDAFICEGVIDPIFDEYGFIYSKEFFTLVYTPVSLTTANPDLQPIISIVNKYLIAGGIDKLDELYKEGNSEYARYKLSRSFTAEEEAYLNNLATHNTTVKIALEQDNYPVSFYNNSEKQFQGIAVDVLAEISKLTDIEFEVVSNTKTTWSQIYDMLRTGEVSLVSQLLYTEKRKDDFLWTDTPYASTSYALLSKADYPNLAIYQVVRAKVGAIDKSAFEDNYSEWFPESRNTVKFSTQQEALSALEAGTIDLLMASDYMLLMQLNYLEKPGYKANIRFSSPMDSHFGFNKDEEILRSIINKAQGFVNTKIITGDWMSRVFDYSRKYTAEFNTFLIFFVIVLFFTLMLVLHVWLKSRQLRRDLIEKTATLSTIFLAIPDLLYSKDLSLNYTSCNPSFEKMIGFTEAEIIGKSALDTYKADPDTARRFTEVDEEVIRDNVMRIVEEWYIFPDGSRRLFECMKVPLVQNGVLTGVMGISRDIMEHKKAEEAALAASKAKSAFLAQMSHEIRTPMNAIAGMTELILREQVPQTIYEYILSVKHASTSLLSLINDILDFSRIEAGNLEIVALEYSLTSLINDVLIITRMKINEKPIIFTINIDCHIPERLLGDETRVRQVLLNVLDNAVKYTNEGFISLVVCGEISGDSVVLTAEITDSGIGIKEEDIKMLFRDFVRIDYVKNTGIQGTGLGLAIAQNLSQAMGGSISARSEYGVGSTFKLIIPQKIAATEDNEIEPFARVNEPEAKRVLLYETRSGYADSIALSLSGLGVDCTVVSDLQGFHTELQSEYYPYVFTSSSLVASTAQIMDELKMDSRLVLLTEFGETPSMLGVRSIALPVHAASIANILNNTEESIYYLKGGPEKARFIAPSARVLVVDDLNTNLKIAEGLMSPYRMCVDVCDSGAEALKRVQANSYDIIFMDHMMPEMDGIEATKRIRALEEQNDRHQTVPIIALTANAISGVKEIFLQNGMSDFLAKPIDIAKLNNLLDKWLPEEKKEKYYEADPASSPAEMNPIQIHPIQLQIEGIDIQTGIARTGGILDNYLKTLTIFHVDCLDKIGKIRECVADKNIKLYTTYVHALKSASASIGAQEISDFAKALELAGVENKVSFILENTESFLDKLATLLQNINAALPKAAVAEGTSDPAFLKSELRNLQEALDNMDAEAVDEAMNSLKSAEWEIMSGEIFAEISRRIYLFNYHEAAALVAELILEYGE